MREKKPGSIRLLILENMQCVRRGGGGGGGGPWGYFDKILHVFLYTDYPILHKLFELWQTALPHEKNVEDFFLPHTQSRRISNFNITFAISG